MNRILENVERSIGLISSFIWAVFLPFMLLLGAYLSAKAILVVKKKTTQKAKVRLKHVIGPASISLGAMVGTGAIIGVLGSLSALTGSGQANMEAIAFWALVGSIVMVPLAYSETLCAKIMKKTPREYIGMLLSRKMSMIYAVGFAALYVFGFGGFQFSGIDSVFTIVSQRYFHLELTQQDRYVYIIAPVCIIVALIVLAKKHSLFMNAMTYMIGTAVAAYFLFFTVFIIRTWSYIPSYLDNMLRGVMNPVNMGMGIPLGFVLGVRRVIQTAETGLGALAMSAEESQTEPREAGVISLIPTVLTIFVSILVTSYIASYGISKGLIVFPADSVSRIRMYFETADYVTGGLGLVILSLFTVLSALTTLLGSYYFLTVLFDNSENCNIAIYLTLIVVAGTLAVFGFNIVFEAVDLLLFVVAAINILALTVFVRKNWKKYRQS